MVSVNSNVRQLYGQQVMTVQQPNTVSNELLLKAMVIQNDCLAGTRLNGSEIYTQLIQCLHTIKFISDVTKLSNFSHVVMQRTIVLI